MASSIRLSIACATTLLALGACSSSENIGSYPDGGGGAGGSRDSGPSVFCAAFSQTCAASINKCTASGGACVASTECCSMSCSGGRCSSNTCVADNQACSSSAA